MRIEWRPGARAELLEILDYISDHDIQAANELSRAIDAAIAALSRHPFLYRTGRVSGTREIVVHPNYVVVYRVTDQIEVLSILHARQEYP